MRRVISLLKTTGAVILGLGLGATPFLRYRVGAPHPVAHMDHAPHHGGILGMVGDAHLEVVRAGGRIAVYPSDAYRRPISAHQGSIELEDGRAVPLAPDGERLVATDDPAWREITCVVELPEGGVARMTVSLPMR